MNTSLRERHPLLEVVIDDVFAAGFLVGAPLLIASRGAWAILVLVGAIMAAIWFLGSQGRS